jgi:hypothetical protein
VTTIAELLQRWTDEAVQLRERYGMEAAARLCDAHVRELTATLSARQDELLTIAAAAVETRYSTQHLRALIAERAIPNAGSKGRPRIRRADLPPPKSVPSRVRASATDPRRRSQTNHQKTFDASRIVRRP